MAIWMVLRVPQIHSMHIISCRIFPKSCLLQCSTWQKAAKPIPVSLAFKGSTTLKQMFRILYRDVYISIDRCLCVEWRACSNSWQSCSCRVGKSLRTHVLQYPCCWARTTVTFFYIVAEMLHNIYKNVTFHQRIIIIFVNRDYGGCEGINGAPRAVHIISPYNAAVIAGCSVHCVGYNYGRLGLGPRSLGVCK